MEPTQPMLTWSERSLYSSLFILTVVTGLIDAASFLGLGHIFTANMTGNIVIMAFASVGVPQLSLVRSATALASALVGGVIAGHLDTRMSWRRRNEWLAFALALETLLLILSAAAATSLMQTSIGSERALMLAIVLTGVAIGIRNGTIRRLAIPDLTTTVLTLTVSGLASESRLTGGNDARWGRRAGSIACMFLGAASGALLLRHSLCLVLATAASLSGACTAVQLLRSETEHEAKMETSKI